MKTTYLLFAVAACVFLALSTPVIADEEECQVCRKVLEKFEVAVKAEKPKELTDFEDLFRRECKKLRNNAKENRLCYYIGGSEDSATSLLRTISQPMKNFVPAATICKRLK